MKIDLGRSAFEGIVGAIAGATIGAFLGSSVTVVAAAGALFGIAWIIKDLARQALESTFSYDKHSAKASVCKLIIEGTIPASLGVAHLAFGLFPPVVVAVVWGLFAIEASVIASNARKARAGLFA